jgi:hypothetical protein
MGSLNLPRLFFQRGGEIRDDCDGVADLLRYAIQQDFLAVVAHLEEWRRRGPTAAANLDLRGAELQSARHFFHGHGVNRVRAVHIEKFLAVVAPIKP